MSTINLNYSEGFSLCVYAPLKNMSDYVANLLMSNKDINKISGEIPSQIRYFLDRNTSHLFDAVKFKKSDKVLEINACFGEITKYLCDKVSMVTAVEFLRKNAEIINARLKDKENLEIIVGNLKNIEFQTKYDYIVLNDILEFATFFFNTKDPYADFIKFCKKLLTPSGKIIITTFNRFGLKNLTGAIDEHSMKKYDSLQDYPKYSLKAFSKNSLEKLLKNAGFKDVKFYYPLPSHFFVHSVTSDEFYKQNSIDYHFIKKAFSGFLKDEDKFDESKIMHEVFSVNEFPFLSNSFFVVASPKFISKFNFYSKYENGIATNICWDFYSDVRYVKYNYYNETGKKFLENMHSYYVQNNRKYKGEDEIVSLCKITKKDRTYQRDYLPFYSLSNLLMLISATKNKNALISFMLDCKKLISALYKDTVTQDYKAENTADVFGNYQIKNVVCVKNSLYNLNLSDIYNDGEKYTVVNYGDVCPHYLPINFLLYTMLFDYCREMFLDLQVLEILNMTIEEIKAYSQMMTYHRSHPDRRFN